MHEKQAKLELEEYEQLNRTIPYLLAGLEGYTNGHKINSVTVQQDGLHGYRVILRAVGVNPGGDTLFFVGFSNGSDPGAALLFAENGYRENVIRWSIDRFAKSLSDNGSSEDEGGKLTIRD